MAFITEITADGDLNTALANFNTVCAANTALLGLTPADMTAIAAASTTFTAALNDATTAKAAARDSVEAKDIQKKASKATVSKYAKLFRANAAVPDNLLDALMLPHHKTPGSKTAPTQPLDLVGSADGNGLVSLKWKRNGNISGTTFLLETRSDPAGPWTLGSTTTKTKATYQAVPGSYVGFRVTAVRRNLMSPASVPFALWEDGGDGDVALKVA
ncbi:MAG: hypothetical protein KF857_06370 [Fimbriimonadaceae bacterium]|nr:hypothetical protein [Fimbriimonadaceae bacterium]